MADLQGAQGTRALSYRPHAIAIDLHRDGVGGVGYQQGAGGAAADFHDLAHQPVSVDQGLADEYAVPLPLVQHQLVADRVRGHADQFGHQHVVTQHGGGIQERAQAYIFRLQGGHLLGTALQDQVFASQALVLFLYLGPGLQVLLAPVPQAHRQVCQPIDGGTERVQHGAGRFQALVAQVGSDQAEDHQNRQQQAQPE